MPSWEDGSERYLAEYRGETIYDAWGGYDPELSKGDEMNAARERRSCEDRFFREIALAACHEASYQIYLAASIGQKSRLMWWLEGA